MSEPSFEATAPSEDSAVMESSIVSAATPTRKQDFNIYTMMLIVSFICLIAGTLILFFELRAYGTFPGEFPWRTRDAVPKTAWVMPLTDELPRTLA